MNYSREELEKIGFATLGENVLVHKTVQMFSPQSIHIGDDVRIDCFSLLSAGEDGIRIGSNVHLAAGVYIFGAGGSVVIEDFCGFSSRVTLYTASDDYSEGYLTNPTVPEDYKKITRGPVHIKKHAIMGSGSVIMPDTVIGVAAAVGALTFVNKHIGEFLIVSGNPMRIIGKRNRKILEMEEAFLCDKARLKSSE